MKKLVVEFEKWLIGTDYMESERPLGSYISEFWFATFGCNNPEKEKELYDLL